MLAHLTDSAPTKARTGKGPEACWRQSKNCSSRVPRGASDENGQHAHEVSSGTLFRRRGVRLKIREC